MRTMLKFIGVASYNALIAKGARHIITSLMRALPANIVTRPRLHHSKIEMSSELTQTLDKITNLTGQPTTLTLGVHAKAAEIFTDASLSHGGVASKDGKVASMPFCGKLWNQLGFPRDECPIHLLEIYVVIMAAKFAPMNIDLLIHCDNQAVVAVCRKESSIDPYMNRAVQVLRNLCGYKDINILLKYVKTDENPADFPSREWICGDKGNKSYKAPTLRNNFLTYRVKRRAIKACFREVANPTRTELYQWSCVAHHSVESDSTLTWI